MYKAILPLVFLLIDCEVSLGENIIKLNSQLWQVTNSNKSIQIQASVPGGIYSDLRHSGIHNEDILYRFNEKKYRWVGYDDWTYSTNFLISIKDLAYKKIYLTFHGVDTVATVFLNNQEVGKCDNMFLQYKFEVKKYLKVGRNQLDVEIKSPVKEGLRISRELPYTIPLECWPDAYNGECHINKLRKMQASFAWDWGPAFPSMGIWQGVELEMRDGLSIKWLGARVEAASVGDWRVQVSAWFEKESVETSRAGIMNITLFPGQHQAPITVQHTVKPTLVQGRLQAAASLLVPKTAVGLWWPNGYEQQRLYSLVVTYQMGNEISRKRFKIGFRNITLVQEPLENNKGLTYYFKVNGVPIFAKGSNWIPSDILPEKSNNRRRIKRLLYAAKQANFNMLRVWGGGLYESDFFYQVCDELGIMIWQDLMFACNMYPTSESFLTSVEEEIRQQVYRLQHHPSIALWAGSNENEAALAGNWYGTSSNFMLYKRDFVKLYVDTIEPAVKETDPTRAYVVSSPSNGLESVKEGYVAKNPFDPKYGDIHYYNYLSNGWDWQVYPRGKFISEYGVQSLPAVATLSAICNSQQDLTLDSEFLRSRQHLGGGYAILNLLIRNNLPQPSNLSSLVYLSQINQAMTMKVETETYRRMRSTLYPTGEGLTMGALYWQLNDVWQAPSWSSIDYSGTWKMLHYFAKHFFAQIIVSGVKTSNERLSVMVISDVLQNIEEAVVVIQVYSWKPYEFTPCSEVSVKTKIEGSKSVEVYNEGLASLVGSCGQDSLIFLRLDGTSGRLAPDNFVFLKPLNTVKYPSSNVKVVSIERVSNYRGMIELESDSLALFVWLEAPGLEGTFSHNGFHMLAPQVTVYFYSQNRLVLQDLIDSLKVQSLQGEY